MTEHIPYSHKELIDLFSDCITKRRFVDKTVNGIQTKTWGGVNNEEGFNLYNFYRLFFTGSNKMHSRFSTVQIWFLRVFNLSYIFYFPAHFI